MSTSSETNESFDEEIPPINNPPNVDTDEDALFEDKAILFRYSSEKTEWISRGSGLLKILKHKTTGSVRIVMRQNMTFVLRCNHYIPYLATLRPLINGNNREFAWTAFDFSDPKKPENREVFAVRFSLPTIAEAFKTQFEIGKQANKAIIEKKGLA